MWVEFNSIQKIVTYARVEVSNEKRSRTRTANQNQSYSESRHQHLESTTTTECKNPLSNSTITDITIRTASPYTMKPLIKKRTRSDKESHPTSICPIRIRGNATINLYSNNIDTTVITSIPHRSTISTIQEVIQKMRSTSPLRVNAHSNLNQQQQMNHLIGPAEAS